MQGYLVSVGNDQLGNGDVIVGPTIGFNEASIIGTGSWTWTGVWQDGNTYTNIPDTGTYYLGTDGNVYFVPDTWQVEDIISATATAAPSFDLREFGSAGDDTDIAAGADDDELYGGTGTGTTGTGSDTIDAGAGDDTVFGGDGADTVIGSGGADSIFAGTGDDVIYGDNDGTETSQAESLNWSDQGAAGTDISNGFTQDTGTMNVTVNLNNDGGNTGFAVSGTTQYVETGVDPFATDSSVQLTGDAGPNSTTSIVFNAKDGTPNLDEVSNVSFRINDIDIDGWTDIVTINAYDLDGNLVTVNIDLGGTDSLDGNTITGVDGRDNADDETGSALITIPGPVHAIEVIYSNGGTVGQALWFTDIHFDTVVDPDGADSISGGDGDDLIYGGADDDIIDGNNDQDTIFGGAGDDTLSGGANADTVYGGTGNDTVDGDGGADSLFGDEGDDILTGGSGNDTLFGGADNDTLSGGNNEDTLFGGTGDDSITGGNGDDTAFGGTGNDDVSMGDGDDVFGNFSDEAGNDTIAGGAGNDSLNGGADDDVVFGGADNDTITGASGNDTLFGGTGDDQFNITDDHEQDTIIGGEDAGDGDIDTVVFSNFTSTQGVTVDYTGFEEGDYNYDGTAGTGSFSQIERLETTDFDDTVDGSASPTGITVDTKDGDDSIIGGAGDDSIDAGTGADTIDGGAGDDTIDLGGPDGDPDLLVFSDGDGSDTVANFDAPIDNGDGTFTGIDMLDVSDLNDLGGDPVNTNDVVVSGPAGGPAVLTFPGGETITLTGITPAQLASPFALNAIGIPLPDGTVSGTAGDDLIDGSYLGDPDGDIVDNDDAIIPGDAANDDLIEAGAGNDSILAGEGDDIIYGDDVSTNGWVYEYYDLDPAGSPSNLEEAGFTDGGANHSGTPNATGTTATLNPAAFDTGDDYALKFTGTINVETGGTYTFSTSSDDGSKLFINGVEVVTNDGVHGLLTENGTVTLGPGPHTIEIIYFENDGGNQLSATISGPDTGGSSTDLATYDNLLNAPDVNAVGGNDTIAGEAGDDVIFGGQGDDTIVLGDGFGDDIVTGGETGETNGDTLDGSTLTGDAVVDFSGDEEGILSVDGNTADFREIEGVVTGSGDDTINSGSGNDSVSTNEGDDTFVITDGFGTDTFNAGEGGETNGDTLDGSALTGDVTVTMSGPEDGTLSEGGDSVTFTDVENIFTGSGDDSITGSTGNDTVVAGSGADTIEGGSGDDSIDLGGPDGDPDVVVFSDGDGTDTISNFDGPIDNGDGSFTGVDTLDVSNLNDLGGDPVNTNDVVVSGPVGGPATLTFPNGETIILTGIDPADLASPFALNAIGIPLPDGTVSGGAGDDLIDSSYLGDPDGDIVDNDDAILPGDAANDDLIEGNGGNDSILAGDGNDEIYGGTGNDTIDGGVGDDTAFGEAGDDTFVVSTDYDADTIVGGETGETGGDTLDATGLTADQNLFFTGDEAGTLNQPATDDVATFSEIEQVNLGAGEDTIDTGTHAATVNAGEGADTFLVNDDFGAATLDGGELGATTNDHIVGAGLTDDVNVTFSSDENGTISDGTTTLNFANIEEITTGSGNDTVTGSAGNEVINTSAGNDTINTRGGDDTITTGAGDDQIIITDGFGTNDVTAGEAGETDGDRLDGAALTGDAVVDFTGNEEGQLAVGSDTVDFTEVEVVATGSGDDVINSGTGNDTVETNEGDDSFVVTGEFGTDSFTAGEGGETNGDVVDASGLTDDTTVVFTGNEEGTLTEDGNTLTFSEVEGVETGAGDDDITSGSGNDSVSTNEGDDTFTITDGFGNDTFDAGEGGETNGDTLDGSALTGDVTVNMTGDEAGTLTDGGDSVTFTDVENIFTGSGDDTVIGGAGNENVVTGAGNDSVSGGEGADTFDTGSGDDTITFAEGDSISSGSGDDTFTLEDLGEASNGTITIDGGSEDSATGDTLQLGDLADLSTLVTVDDGTGSLSGSVTLDDGTLLTFSEIETIICFTPGTLIATPQGARDIATLQVGDSVVTRDHGLQKIRWIQSRTVPATDRFAPIRIRPGVVTGQEEDLLVSPQHRMLFQGYRAELLFGETEVLVAAKHLIDGQDVTQEEGGMVTYIHMMFDQHEVVYANGAASESFHPGSVGLTAVTDEAREELFTLFPELRSDPNHYGQTARRCLKKHETELLKP